MSTEKDSDDFTSYFNKINKINTEYYDYIFENQIFDEKSSFMYLKGLYLLSKENSEKEWNCYKLISVSHLSSYHIIKNGSFATINKSKNCKLIIVDKEDLDKAIKKGILIKDNFPSDLLTNDEESIKGIIE